MTSAQAEYQIQHPLVFQALNRNSYVISFDAHILDDIVKWSLVCHKDDDPLALRQSRTQMFPPLDVYVAQNFFS